MRKFISATFGLYLAAAGVAHGQDGRALPPPDPTKVAQPELTANEKLAQAIAQRMRANAKLKRFHVDVEVTDGGVVELSGQVADAKQRDEVVQTIQAVPGVARIRDNLTTAAVAAVLEASKPAVKTTSETPVTAAKAAPTQPAADVVPAAPVANLNQDPTVPVQAAAAPAQTVQAPATSQLDLTPLQPAPAAPLAPSPQAELLQAPQAPPMVPMMPVPMMAPHHAQPQMAPQYAHPQYVYPQYVQPQYAWAPMAPTMQPGVAPRAGGPPEPLPIFTAQPGGMPNPHLQPPPLPPNAWPTYAPYNNVSRVAYPNQYPYEAWPIIGPMYPFPKIPLGWRNVTLSWRDGYWWYGREASGHDWWRIRYW